MAEKNTQKISMLEDFILGGISGCIAKTVCAPIERVKIVLQVQYTNPEAVKDPYNGIADCFKKIYQREGLYAFWRGNLPNVLRYIPTVGINFAIKDKLQRVFMSGIDKNKEYWKFFAGNLMAGGSAGAIGLTVVYSLDLARTRLAGDVKASGSGSKRQFTGLVDCYQKIYAKDGMAGLYRGFGISVVGIFIYRSLYFGLFDSTKDFLQPLKDSFVLRWLSAQVIVIVSETISFPLDTVRRRLMMQSGLPVEQQKYSGTVDCFGKILAQEKWTGFFKGNMANVYRSFGSSMVLVLYDEFKKFYISKKHQ